jgi:predicted phage tail protein
MSGDVAGLDIRVPIGALFAVLGAILVAYGLATSGNTAQYARSAGVNINLWWGVVMLVFGVALLVASRSKRPRT